MEEERTYVVTDHTAFQQVRVSHSSFWFLSAHTELFRRAQRESAIIRKEDTSFPVPGMGQNCH